MSTHYSMETKRAAVAEWKAGVSRAEVMTKYGIKSNGRLSAWAKNLGKPTKAKRYPLAIREKALALRANGVRSVDVANQLKVPRSMIYYWTHAQKSNGETHVEKELNVSASAVGHRNAITLLRKGKSLLLAGIRDHTINDLDNVHLMAMLALNSLTGGEKS